MVVVPVHLINKKLLGNSNPIRLVRHRAKSYFPRIVAGPLSTYEKSNEWPIPKRNAKWFWGARSRNGGTVDPYERECTAPIRLEVQPAEEDVLDVIVLADADAKENNDRSVQIRMFDCLNYHIDSVVRNLERA